VWNAYIHCASVAITDFSTGTSTEYCRAAVAHEPVHSMTLPSIFTSLVCRCGRTRPFSTGYACRYLRADSQHHDLGRPLSPLEAREEECSARVVAGGAERAHQLLCFFSAGCFFTACRGLDPEDSFLLRDPDRGIKGVVGDVPVPDLTMIRPMRATA
jgi:hypothetical protein